MKFIARKPIVRTEVYRKYGFTYVEHKPFYCPRCNHVLNAGPNYQPNFCSNCGQKMDFSGAIWTEERNIGIDSKKSREVDERQRKGSTYA